MEFKRCSWSLNDPIVANAVDELIWGVLQYGVTGKNLGSVPAPDLSPASLEALAFHELVGMAAAVYGKNLTSEVLSDADLGHQRSNIFMHELNWLVGPSLGSRVIPIGAASAQSLYKEFSGKGASTGNPRHVRSLILWAPTLQAREELGEILKLGAYQEVKSKSDEESSIYRFQKNTAGIMHTVVVRSVLWQAGKNWITDEERAIWDRAREDSSGKLRLENTDQLTMSIRHFTVDTLLGSASEFLDILRILYTQENDIDWQRIRAYKNQFGKCDWLWATFFAVDLFEKKTGIGLRLPGWAREGMADLDRSFWPTFVESRLVWASPDSRFTDFSRAHVKLARGT